MPVIRRTTEPVRLRRSELSMSITAMAHARLKAKGPAGELSMSDVRALLARAYHDGSVSSVDYKALEAVEAEYASRMDPDALSALKAFTAKWLHVSSEPKPSPRTDVFSGASGMGSWDSGMSSSDQAWKRQQIRRQQLENDRQARRAHELHLQSLKDR